MSADTWWGVIGTAISFASILINILQAIRRHDMAKSFRAQLRAINGQLALATRSTNDLRSRTRELGATGASLPPEVIRAVSILAGDLFGYINGASKHVQEFSREFLGLRLSTWKESVEEFNSASGAGEEAPTPP